MKKGLVYVGMSGGVDSSVAAALLKKQGFDVVGVFMKPWSPNNEARSRKQEASNKKDSETHDSRFVLHDSSFCLWQQDREDALRAAAAIGIPLKTWDFSREYKKSVTDYMIREYKAGRTPNPDVMCNKEIKFGLFLKKALKEGADFIATGHYVIKSEIRSTKSETNSKFQLVEAKDKNKDQSYFLWTLTQEQLKYCLFPIGDYKKPDVRKLAKKFKLPNHAKKDSQGVCFIGPLDMKEFLKKYIKPKRGEIRILQARPVRQVLPVVGHHDGVYYYTIGQRHGLDIKDGGGPYYVAAKDIRKNIIYVGDNAATVTTTARVGEFNWLGKIKLPATLDVKVRYRAKSSKATLFKNGTLKFAKPERAVTSGQSAVFYQQERLVGGGIII